MQPYNRCYQVCANKIKKKLLNKNQTRVVVHTHIFNKTLSLKFNLLGKIKIFTILYYQSFQICADEKRKNVVK